MIRVSDIISELNLNLLSGKNGVEKIVLGAYTCDLLSDVMGNAEPECLWISMQTHKNIVAVADLKDLAGIIIVNGNLPDQDTIQKSDELGIPIMNCDDNAFTISGKLYKILVK